MVNFYLFDSYTKMQITQKVSEAFSKFRGESEEGVGFPPIESLEGGGGEIANIE